MKLDKYLTEADDFEDLDYMNNWDKGVPDIVKKCGAKHHKLTYSIIGRCELEYECPICKYKYRVDSSD